MVDPEKGRVTIEARAIPIAALIGLFEGREGRFVVDKTGLKGFYNIPNQTLDVGPFEMSFKGA